MGVSSFAVPLAVIIALHGQFVLGAPHGPEPQGQPGPLQLDHPINQVVQALGTANNGSIAKTWKDSLNTMAGLIGNLVEGRWPSASDLVGLAKTIAGAAVEALGLVNPLLGIGIGFAFSFLGGMLGGGPDVSKICYDMIYKLVPSMIEKSIRTSDLKTLATKVQGLVDEDRTYIEMLGDNSDLRRTTAWKFMGDVTEVMPQAFGDCWKTPGSDDCKKWQAAGSAIPAAMVATLHIHSLVEVALAFDRPEDAFQRNVSLSDAISYMAQYQQLLADSLKEFTASRQQGLADGPAKMKMDYSEVFGRTPAADPPVIIVSCQGTCKVQNSVDTFDNTDAWAWCGPPSPPPGPDAFIPAPDEVQYTDKGKCDFPTAQVNQLVVDCQQKYLTNVQGQISNASDLVQSFVNLLVPVPVAFAVPDGKYKILVQKTGKRLHVQQLKDKLLSTRVQEDTIYTRFWIQNVGEGYVTIYVEVETQILYADPKGKRLVSTIVHDPEAPNRTQYMLKPQGDGSFAVAVRGDGWAWFANENGDQLVSTISSKPVKDCSKFLFQLIPEESQNAVLI